MTKPDTTQPAAAKPQHQQQPNPKQSTCMAKQQLTDPEDAKLEAAEPNTAKPKATNKKPGKVTIVDTIKRWMVSRLEHTKPSTTGIIWWEQEGAYKKG